MRRDQIHKICLNHVLTPEIEYKRKDDKSWLFVVGDYSESELEVRSFCLRFKNSDIASEFKQAIDDALGDESRVVENGHGSEEDKEMMEDDKNVRKLQLPSNFYDYKKQDDCKGCRGCNSDTFVMPDYASPVKIETEIPLDLEKIKLEGKARRRGSKPKRVSFSVDDSLDTDKSTTATEVKSDPKSIFTSALNTIPAVSQTPPSNNSIFGNVGGATEGGNLFSGSGFSSFGTKTSIFGGVNTTKPVPELKSIFGVGAATPTSDTKTIFGGGLTTTTSTSESKPLFGGTGTGLFSTNSFGTAATNTNTIFGGKATFETSITAKSTTPVFGSNTTSFSFADAAKELKQSTPDTNGNSTKATDRDENKNSPIPDFLKADTGPSFASVASNASNNNVFGGENAGKSEGFVGLTVKEDIFTKLAKQKAGETTKDETGEDSNANDENYDPHYDPIIALPDEIQLSTGEEEEEKLFGERAKLYRYSTDTKEWKERGKFYFLECFN